jgi:hypothetical protein
MNERSDAREKQPYSKKLGWRDSPQKGQARFGVPLENFYSWERKRNVGKLQKNIARFQFGVVIQNFIPFQRNIRNGHFVYTGAAGYRAVQDEIQKKPRGGSRGVMTRSLSGR